MHPNCTPHDRRNNQIEYTRSKALNAALSYARRGQRVFPCGENKAPLIAGGFKNATTDARLVHMWWNRWPEARIGLPTGEKFFVVDVDRLEALGERVEDVGRFVHPALLTARVGEHVRVCPMKCVWSG